MVKTARARYTLEYKLEAVRMVKGGQSMSAVSKILGIAEQTLYNWVKASREGRLVGTGARPVDPQQMELARLRAELARVKMERDILKKATAYFRVASRHEVRMDRAQPTPLASLAGLRGARREPQRLPRAQAWRATR